MAQSKNNKTGESTASIEPENSSQQDNNASTEMPTHNITLEQLHTLQNQVSALFSIHQELQETTDLITEAVNQIIDDPERVAMSFEEILVLIKDVIDRSDEYSEHIKRSLKEIARPLRHVASLDMALDQGLGHVLSNEVLLEQLRLICRDY
ncbi:hypothetical protein D6D02_09275 [Aureobasidium pullulans]|nr:hypothetical protein D6D03_08809 [Aureobasidium pullulans]THX98969.1 hypothetical protein D6D02_09275 [Aureobasidium pullulans]THZ14614.1 hypothetical protein D6C89_10079 [Aureobasidium pullulans]THZ91976.1 hypothetical protein D6C82_09666 [Aureobasidium pullulans]